MGADDSSTVVARIAQQLIAVCPPGWQRAQVRWRQVGPRQEHDAAAVDTAGRQVVLTVPANVLELLARLRRQQHAAGTGPWFSARIRLAPPDQFAVDTDAAEPRFRGDPPTVDDFAHDLAWTTPPPWLAGIHDGAALARELPRVLPTVGAGQDAIVFDGPPQRDRWNIHRADGHWWAQRGARLSPAFATADDAVAYALGHLVLVQTGATDRAEAEVFRVEHPIDALPGDPPLTLFRNLYYAVLAAGTMLDRLGAATGNVTYLAGTPLPMRSLPAELTEQPGRDYRVRRPVEVLLGMAVAWFGQPGGGTACVLPASVEELVRAGVLELTGSPARSRPPEDPSVAHGRPPP